MVEDSDLYLTFNLGDEMYGIDTRRVSEITGVVDTTRVPSTPSFVLGVVNLRGKVVPVVDLRVRLGLEARARDERTSIIVMKLENEDSEISIGVEVDAVSEVLRIPDENIDPPPQLEIDSTLDFIQNVAKVEENVILILDTDAVLGHGNLLESS
jgi:purine-binding chemotaxis protein CheW